MKRFSEQFKKQAESIHMKASERAELRARVLSYVEYHPLPKEMAQKASSQKAIASEPFVTIRISPLYFRSFAGVFAVFLILGVPFVAERAMPGDMLYPVKVQFNEELRSGLSLSPYAKVAWETERLERRIAEARLLASEGKLTEETQQEVADAIKTHTDAAQREIAVLRESDSDEAAIAEITFASALAVQTEVLESHTEGEATPEGSSVATLVLAVAEARDTAEASQSGVLPSYDRLLGKVEEESTRIYELFETVRKDASTEEITNIERRLADIERKIAKATGLKDTPEVVVETGVVTEEPVDATQASTSSSSESTTVPVLETQVAQESSDIVSVEILRSALADIQKLINYMTHIDVRRSVSIEELVPLTLTPQEQTAESVLLQEKIAALQEKIESREITTAVTEKVLKGQQELQVRVTAAVKQIAAGNNEAALPQLREAYAIALDLDRLTENAPQKETPVVSEQIVGTSTEASI